MTTHTHKEIPTRETTLEDVPEDARRVQQATTSGRPMTDYDHSQKGHERVRDAVHHTYATGTPGLLRLCMGQAAPPARTILWRATPPTCTTAILRLAFRTDSDRMSLITRPTPATRTASGPLHTPQHRTRVTHRTPFVALGALQMCGTGPSRQPHWGPRPD